jgi:hypothetical protein
MPWLEEAATLTLGAQPSPAPPILGTSGDTVSSPDVWIAGVVVMALVGFMSFLAIASALADSLRTKRPRYRARALSREDRRLRRSGRAHEPRRTLPFDSRTRRRDPSRPRRVSLGDTGRDVHPGLPGLRKRHDHAGTRRRRRARQGRSRPALEAQGGPASGDEVALSRARGPLPVRLACSAPGTVLVLGSSKAVRMSSWLNRQTRKEKTVPKLLRARAPRNAVEGSKVRKLAVAGLLRSGVTIPVTRKGFGPREGASVGREPVQEVMRCA